MDELRAEVAEIFKEFADAFETACVPSYGRCGDWADKVIALVRASDTRPKAGDAKQGSTRE